MNLRGDTTHRRNQETKNIAATTAGFTEVKALEVTVAGVLAKDDILITGRRPAQASRIKAREADPRFNREVGWPQQRGVRNRYEAVGAIKTKCRTDDARSRCGCAAEKVAVVRS